MSTDVELTLSVDVFYSQFTVVRDGAAEGDSLSAKQDLTPILTVLHDGTIRFLVAREDGVTPVRVRISSSEPPQTADADDVVELSFTATRATRLTGWDGSGAVHDLPVCRDTSYRIRYAVRGADTAGGAAPRDEYTIELWPQPPLPARVLRAGSNWMRALAVQQANGPDEPRQREQWVVSAGDPEPRLMRFVDGVAVGRGFATRAEADADAEWRRQAEENLRRVSRKRR